MRATGQARRCGPATGGKARVKVPRGSRRIKPLAVVYQNEGIPAATPAPDGERRYLAESKLEAFAESVQQERIVARRSQKELADEKTR